MFEFSGEGEYLLFILCKCGVNIVYVVKVLVCWVGLLDMVVSYVGMKDCYVVII